MVRDLGIINQFLDLTNQKILKLPLFTNRLFQNTTTLK